MEHETQKPVYDWCTSMFPKHVGTKGRAVALVEEAVELALAAGVNADVIQAAVKVPMLKELIRLSNGERSSHQREDAEEIADVLVCVYAYAEEAGYDAHDELDKKMAINRSRPKEYYAAKTAQKEDLGFILPDAPER